VRRPLNGYRHGRHGSGSGYSRGVTYAVDICLFTWSIYHISVYFCLTCSYLFIFGYHIDGIARFPSNKCQEIYPCTHI
jgi:hypothetical protein